MFFNCENCQLPSCQADFLCPSGWPNEMMLWPTAATVPGVRLRVEPESVDWRTEIWFIWCFDMFWLFVLKFHSRLDDLILVKRMSKGETLCFRFARPELCVFDSVRLDRTNGGVLRYLTKPYNARSFQLTLISIILFLAHIDQTFDNDLNDW